MCVSDVCVCVCVCDNGYLRHWWWTSLHLLLRPRILLLISVWGLYFLNRYLRPCTLYLHRRQCRYWYHYHKDLPLLLLSISNLSLDKYILKVTFLLDMVKSAYLHNFLFVVIINSKVYYPFKHLNTLLNDYIVPFKRALSLDPRRSVLGGTGIFSKA